MMHKRAAETARHSRSNSEWAGDLQGGAAHGPLPARAAASTLRVGSATHGVGGARRKHMRGRVPHPRGNFSKVEAGKGS